MRKILFIIIFISTFYILNSPCFTQNKNIDSLLKLVSINKADTNQINHLNKLCVEFINVGLYDTALYYCNSALQLAQQLLKVSSDKNDEEIRAIKKGIANSYNQIGVVHFYKADYLKTAEYWLNALKIDEELKDKNGIAKRLGNLGIIYVNQGDYPKALDYYFKALKIAEEIGDKKGIASDLGHIGIVYKEQKEYPKALEYYIKALKIDEELRNKNGIERHLGNIGIVYNEQGDYPKALNYYFMALDIAEELGDKNGISTLFSNIGNVYIAQKDYHKALEYNFKTLKMAKELGNKNRIAICLGNIGSLYTKAPLLPAPSAEGLNSIPSVGLGWAIAYTYIYRALAISDSIGARAISKNHYEMLSNLYEKSNIPLRDSIGGKLLTMEEMRLKAMYYYKRSIAIRDALFSEENKKQLVRKEMNFEFDKKEGLAKVQQEKKDAIAMAESKKQQMFLWFILAIAIAIAAIAAIIYRSLSMTKKQKQIIEIQKKHVEVQNEEITKQKKLVEEKNHEISSSISYAKRIQRSFLTAPSIIKRHLPEHFILFKPRDVVSGDFYWMHQQDDYTYFCVADCTGHGIPGAFMSLIGMGILNEIVYSKNILNTNDILNELRRIVILAVNPEDAVEESKDGMDLVYLRIHHPTKELQYSAANNSFYVCRKGELKEYKPDKMPVGKFGEYEKPFTQHTITLEDDDVIYAITDGFADQFGGPKGKKFKYKQLEDILVTNANRPMQQQSEILNARFNEWKGDLEQVDDVTIIGIRI